MWKGEPGESTFRSWGGRAVLLRTRLFALPAESLSPPGSTTLRKRPRLTSLPGGCAEYALVAGADDESTTSDKPTSPTTDDEDSDAGTAGSAPSPLTPISNTPFEDAFSAAHPSAASHSGPHYQQQQQQQHKSTGTSALRIVTMSSPVNVKTEDIVPDLMSTSPFFSSSSGLSASSSYAVPRSFNPAPAAPSPLGSPGVLLGPDLTFATTSYNHNHNNNTPVSPESHDAGYPSYLTHVHSSQSSSSIPRTHHHRSSSSFASGSAPSTAAAAALAPQTDPVSRVIGFTLWSEQSSICTAPLNAFGDCVRAAMRVSLQVPGPMSVVPAVSFSAPWKNATCTTTMAINGQVITHDRAVVSPPTAMVPGAPLVVCLPDPLLSNYRWLDYGSFPTLPLLCSVSQKKTHFLLIPGTLTIAQKLLVENLTTVLIEYTVTRCSSDIGPNGQVYDIRGCAADGSPRWSPAPISPAPVLPGGGGGAVDLHASPVVGSGSHHPLPPPPLPPRVTCAPTTTTTTPAAQHHHQPPCGYLNYHAAAINSTSVMSPGVSGFGPYC